MARNLGQKTETRILKKIKAQKQPASGSIPGIPNDGIKGKYLIEVKSTVRGSLSVKREWLEALDESALLRSKTGALIVVFNNATRALLGCQEWVAIPLSAFERMSNGWKK